MQGTYEEFVRGRLGIYREPIMPRVIDCKSRITMWMALWPWSLLWTVVNDLIKRLWEEIYNFLRAIYQAVINHAFRNVKQYLPQIDVQNRTRRR